MPGKREGRVHSYLTFLLILLVALAGLPAAHVAPSSVQSADNSKPSQADSTTLQGEVLKMRSVFEDGLIVTYVDFLVTRILTGSASLVGNNITIKYTGGEVNGVLLWVSGQPYFCVGETVEIEVRQEGEFYVPVSQKRTLSTAAGVFATSAGYVLMWYRPGTGWQVSTTRPGSDWYGPAKLSAGALGYRINTANMPADVSSSSFITYLTASFQTWEDDSGSSIDFSYLGTGAGTAGSQDGANTVGWRSIGGSTIAVTYDWASYSTGDYNSLRITETDMIFDSSKPWSAQSSGVTGRYDVQNIGTHEAGHTFGLGDMYDAEDSEQTMYGYGSTGETKKRTLEWGDRAGVAALYPSGVTVTTTVTVTSTEKSTSFSYRTATTTVTSYTSTSTSTSTIPTLTTVALVPLTVTSTIQSIEYLTSILTTTLIRYTGTETSTSTIVVPTTVTVAPSTVTTTVQTTQVLTSTGSTTVTGYTTTTSTSYTATTTSTSTAVVYTTVTTLRAMAGGASSPLVYIGFLSLLAVTVGHRASARMICSFSRKERRCPRN